MIIDINYLHGLVNVVELDEDVAHVGQCAELGLVVFRDLSDG